jgi:hypothetical protein
MALYQYEYIGVRPCEEAPSGRQVVTQHGLTWAMDEELVEERLRIKVADDYDDVQQDQITVREVLIWPLISGGFRYAWIYFKHTAYSIWK